jgi:hypothetical protein
MLKTSMHLLFTQDRLWGRVFPQHSCKTDPTTYSSGSSTGGSRKGTQTKSLFHVLKGTHNQGKGDQEALERGPKGRGGFFDF